MNIDGASSDISTRFSEVMADIERFAVLAGRPTHDVKLVVVTKTHPVEKLSAVIEAGARLLGENYAEEAAPKIKEISNPDVEWHMIGHVQSRKVDIIAEYFDWVHSVDSLKLATRLNREAVSRRKIMPVLLEINVSGEESKFGLPGWETAHVEGILSLAQEIVRLENLELRGLMTIAPWGTDHDSARPFFARLRRLKDQLKKSFPSEPIDTLSMGMSSDYQGAIMEGATLLRIGTAIMGARS